jgi:NAD(P)-dependent dehydrogenase (short-subunit alcohol dehydrogenase family)
MGRLKGKVAVVVGAGSSAGFGWSNGKAVAAVYAREGASVLAVDFDAARAEDAAQAIRGEGHVAEAFRADATSNTDMEAAMAHAAKTFGGIDIVHNNVGSGAGGAALHEYSLKDWDTEIAISLKSAFLGMRAGIPHLLKRGGGAIINTSSIAAVRPLLRGKSPGYTAAKAGVEAMTRAAASEYGPDNIRVNCIRIGYSDTPLVRGMYQKAGITGEALDAKMKESGAMVPLRNERTTVWDVANAALYFASDDARGITGVIMNVDGGVDVMAI